ncbi:SDR family oxidoreductase [Herbidospora mongoliensis]|uniref:SDR family oxidoreductase n=1 Tax=Herbidospora mongoliensis TaxID=688067 RepID=UPI0008323085|nr:SDR family oxidoreductase [Herbidospora mongoliensis]
MKIVVIGGTGLIGSRLIEKLTEHGHEAVAAAPSTGVNTLTGEGLAEALEGAQVVVDVSNSPSWERDAVWNFFTTSTSNVLAAEKKAGVGHHVAVSIVGSEKLPANDYFRAKIAQEELIEKSDVPYSLVHATQFFEFVKGIADEATRDDGVHVAPVRFQPIAGAEVSENVGKVAVGAPLNGRLEIAGPEQYQMDEFFRGVLKALGDPRTVVTDPHARYFGSELEQGTLVPGDGATLGRIDYYEWLKTNQGK